LFGGTFDPVHLGHTHAAGAVCDGLRLAEIRLVLSARPAHRDPTAASQEHRWRMLCLACEADSRLVADDCEMRRDTPSFTVDTLSEMRVRAGGEALLWVIGSDALADLPSWYRWQEVLELCNLVVLQRPGHKAHYPPQVRQLIRDRGSLTPPADAHGRIFTLRTELLGISASEVRQALGQGLEAGHLLNPQVAAYISQHGLYGVTREV
jgi:nicotinate-nucleotide adenylyltransferase